MSIRIGITGGIGSGKSMVSRLLSMMGIPMYISDIEARRLTLTDPDIRRELTALIGNDIYTGSLLNKELLATYMFGNPTHLQTVNGIIHPRVRNDFRQWAEQQQKRCPLVGMESAILIESGFAGEVDAIIMVYAPEEVRITRAMQRDGASRAEIERRICSQMNDEEKRRHAQYVVYNDGETALIPQVLQLIDTLSQNISYLCPPNK
ncbi:MAG: dephospho-CoA kinase [Prevotellaceae bacterium]|jgi:dephospho-CoA kinase|nr:dephospho-CoA kinase [Prevotellaceae bacterium]